jgi:hypothetical protein
MIRRNGDRKEEGKNGPEEIHSCRKRGKKGREGKHWQARRRRRVENKVRKRWRYVEEETHLK